MAQKILFIGGTRFFGRRIVSGLIEHGHRVTLMTRSDKTSPGIEHIQCDRKDGAAFEKALAGRDFDAVIDNICYQPADAERAVKVLSGRCQRYIFTSSVMSYLNVCLDNRAMMEQDWAAAHSTAGLEIQYGSGELDYARNKRACEQVFLDASGFKPIVLRLQNVVGEDDFSGKSGLLTGHLRDNDGRVRMVGSPGDLYQQVYAGDLATIYRLAIELPMQHMAGAYNVAAPSIPVADYVELLSAGSRVEFVDNDADGVLARGVPYPKNVVLDCTLLQRDFGFAFTGYEDFLPDIAHWYNEKAGL